MNIRALIIDDETLARDTIRTYLGPDDRITVVGECANGAEGLAKINDLKPDLIFLDIEMPKMSGITLLESDQLEHMPMIIFSTAYDEFALKAFELNAIDYLLKPFDKRRFAATLQKAIQVLKAKNIDQYAARMLQFQHDHKDLKENNFPDKLVVKDNKRIFYLKSSDVSLIKGSGDYVEIHWNNNSKLIYRSISEMERRMDPLQFRRIHKSYIINIKKVTEIRSHSNGEYFFYLEDGEVIKSGRTYKDNIRDLIETNI